VGTEVETAAGGARDSHHEQAWGPPELRADAGQRRASGDSTPPALEGGQGVAGREGVGRREGVVELEIDR
jgi:hypothetical protein